ncbi:MAG: hypothetical protein NC332_05665 [Firmicutes bacterium]|nr:hypothetical protein [Bacillota bacterium]
MNFFAATLKREGDTVRVSFEGTDNVLEIPFRNLLKVRPEYFNGDKKIIVGLRCEHISADPEIIKKSKNVVKVKISHFEELGNETLIYGDLDMNGDGLSDTETRVIVKQYGGTHTSKIGDVIDVAFDMERAHFFDLETEKTIAPRIPEDNVFDVTLENDKMTLLGASVKLPEAIVKQLNGVSKENATVIIPANALREGDDIKAKVVDTEVINGTKITHLQIKNRTFFMVGDKDYKVGDELSLGIDFKRISIDGAAVSVKPLPDRDVFYGSYFDRTNAKRSVSYLVKYYNEQKKKEISELNKQLNAQLAEFTFQESMLKVIKEEYAEKRKEILGNKSYRLGTESLGKEGKKKVEQEAKEALALAKQEYDAKVAEYNAAKAAYNALSEAEKSAGKEKENALRGEYKKLEDAVAEKYAKIIQQIQSNVESVAKELLPLEQSKALEAKADAERANADYARIKTERIAELDAAIEKAKADVATLTGADKDNAVIALKDAKRAKIDGIAQVKSEQNAAIDDIMFRSKVFTAYINGQSFLTSLDINKKIIKGLGAQLFLSHYRFEVPHDAYTVVDKGIELTVEEIIDYGKDKYAKCSLYGDTVYVKIDKDYEIGAKINVNLDVTASQIYENLFDIRLY